MVMSVWTSSALFYILVFSTRSSQSRNLPRVEERRFLRKGVKPVRLALRWTVGAGATRHDDLLLYIYSAQEVRWRGGVLKDE